MFRVSKYTLSLQASQSTGNMQHSGASKSEYSRSQLEASAAGKDDFFRRKQAVSPGYFALSNLREFSEMICQEWCVWQATTLTGNATKGQSFPRGFLVILGGGLDKGQHHQGFFASQA